MRNKLRGIAFILFGFLLVYTMNVWNPSIPIPYVNKFLLPACDIAGLVFGVIGLLCACKPDSDF